MLRVLFPDLLHSSRKGRDRGMVKRMFSFWALHRVTVWHGLAAQHDAWRSTTPFCRGLGATLSVECGVSYVESNAKLAENSVLLKVQSLEIKGW